MCVFSDGGFGRQHELTEVAISRLKPQRHP